MESDIYTIGYEGVTADALVETLLKAKIDILIDVRAVPLSRKPGFSKNKLATRLAENNIRYLGLKTLGTPAAGRDAARKGRVSEMETIFAEHLQSEGAIKGLNDAIQVAGQNRTCLLCFEHNPGCCHRSMVADRIAERNGQKIVHLNPVIGNLI